MFANRAGPKPIRDRQYPRGFPWLEAKSRQLADEGNSLADFTVDLIWAATAAGVILFVEFPDDLGKAQLGTPASLRQRGDLKAVAEGKLWRGAF